MPVFLHPVIDRLPTVPSLPSEDGDDEDEDKDDDEQLTYSMSFFLIRYQTEDELIDTFKKDLITSQKFVVIVLTHSQQADTHTRARTHTYNSQEREKACYQAELERFFCLFFSFFFLISFFFFFLS